MVALPEWMCPSLTNETPRASAQPLSGRGRNTVRHALKRFAQALGEMLADQSIAERPGQLQGLDPRSKILGLLGLLVLTSFLHTLLPLLGLLAVCLALTALSRIPVSRVCRAWLAVPLFSLALILPATLNLITPGAPVLTLWHFHADAFGPWRLPDVLAVTDHGLYTAARFLLRVSVCVMLALLLTTTTRPDRLFRGLRVLGVPQLFVMLLGMMERYLGVILRVAHELHLGKLSRSVLPGTQRQERQWVAVGIGSLFRRVQALGDSVYLAMLSRGYTGEVYLLDEPRLRRRDWVFLVLVMLVGMGLFVLP